MFLHGFEQDLLMFFGQVRQFHRRAHGDPAVIHKLQQLRDEVGEADIALDCAGTIIDIFSNQFITS